MKKKVFSKLLMVALVATVGAFTSCKDYDDDINDLRSQINGMNTSVTTLVDSKISGVSSTVSTLQSQLADVKTAYAAADAALQKAIDEAKATGSQNATTITSLQGQLAQLDAAKANLENAIATLQAALTEANTTLKTHGESIANLIAADKTLENAINTATANASNALTEAQKAQATASENASNLVKANAEIAALQKTVADNLTSVNAAIETAVADLKGQIATLNGKVAELSTTAAKNEANITTILAKLTSLEGTDKDLLSKIETVNKELAEKIQKNLDEITKIKDVTIAEVRNAMTGEAKAAVAEAMKNALDDYLTTEDVEELIAAAKSENQSLIEALTEKVKQDSTDIRNYVDVEFLQVVKELIAAEKEETTAGSIAAAYKTADETLQKNINTVSGDLAALAEIVKGTEDAQGLVGKITEVQAMLSSENGLSQVGQSILASEEFASAVSQAVGEINGEVLNMITSISLFGNQHHNDDVSDNYYSEYWQFNHELSFLYTTEYNNVFPKKDDFVFNDKLFVNTDKNYTFVQGTLRTESDSILVRVSPVTARLTPSNVILLDSKGNDIVNSGLIQIESVHKYDGLLTTTRAAAESGLWVIKFKLAEGDNGEAFEKAALTKVNGAQNQILYAVGARNTESAADRYVVSEYDLTLNWAPSARVTTFTVNGISIDQLKNRYNYCEDGSRSDILKQGSTTQGQHPELIWLQERVNGVWTDAAYTTVKASGNGQNAGDPRFETSLNYNSYPYNNDDRQTRNVLKVLPGEDISIVYDNTGNKRIKGFYVTLDADFALESAPSEYNAWTSYEYENVGYALQNNGVFTGEFVPATMQDGNSGKIVIKNTKNVLHDIIGFRVYAVNLDGTLVDPDGRAFYVYVGEDLTANEIATVNVTTTVQTPSAIPGSENRGSKTFTQGLFTENQYQYANGYIRWDFMWGENNPAVLANDNATLTYPLANNYRTSYDANGNYWSVPFYSLFNLEFRNGNNDNQWQSLGNTSYVSANSNNILSPYTNAVRAQIKDAARLLDGETYTIKAVALRYGNYEDNNQTYTRFLDTVQVVNIKIKKNVPTSLPSKFKIRANQLANNRTLNVYVKPVQGSYNVANYAANAQPMSTNNSYWQVANAGNFNYVADVKPYDFADIFTGLTTGNENNLVWDQNYVFEVTKSDIGNKSIFVGYDYQPSGSNVAVWGFGTAPWNSEATTSQAYSLPAVHKSYVDDNTEKLVKISYIYRNISLTKNANGTANGPKDFTRTLETVDPDAEQSAFYVKFNCALNIPSIGKMNNNQIVSTQADAWTKYDGDSDAHKAQVKTYNNRFVTSYESDYTLSLDQLVLNPQQIPGLKHSTAEKAGHIGILLTKTYEPTNYSWAEDYSYITLKDLFNNGVLKRGSISLNTTDYYTASWTNNDITLRRVRSYDAFLASDLQSDVPHTVTINVEDVFGHKFAYSFTVTMKKPAMHARQK